MALSSGQTDHLIFGQFSKTADVAVSYPCPWPCFLATDRSCIFILLILWNQIIHVALCLGKIPSHPSLPQYTAKKNLPLKHGRIDGVYWSYAYYIFQIKWLIPCVLVGIHNIPKIKLSVLQKIVPYGPDLTLAIVPGSKSIKIGKRHKSSTVCFIQYTCALSAWRGEYALWKPFSRTWHRFGS